MASHEQRAETLQDQIDRLEKTLRSVRILAGIGAFLAGTLISFLIFGLIPGPFATARAVTSNVMFIEDSNGRTVIGAFPRTTGDSVDGVIQLQRPGTRVLTILGPDGVRTDGEDTKQQARLHPDRLVLRDVESDVHLVEITISEGGGTMIFRDHDGKVTGTYPPRDAVSSASN